MKNLVEIEQFLNNADFRFVRGGVKRLLFHEGVFDEIISLENLLAAWYEFRNGKRNKSDVRAFELHLEDNIFRLHEALRDQRYSHSRYSQFQITDPKLRVISKACIADRLLHKAIYRVLYPKWDTTFIYDSYSCRNEKGTHKAFSRLCQMTRSISKNYTQPCFALKCDIRKFFDSIDHDILIGLLHERVADKKLLSLLEHIIRSFEHSSGKGMPLGNLTSQLFANIYMDPLDKFVKHRLKAKYYLRYADDFIFLSDDSSKLMGYLVEVNQFLKTRLKLTLHPDKISLRKLNWGIDYVGYVALPHYSIPRRKTIQRMTRRIARMSVENKEIELAKIMPSYLGYLRHVDSHRIAQQMRRLSDVIHLTR